MAEQIVSTMERFGPKRFKSMGYRTLQRIIDSGAMGAEINISGRGLPGSRAKTWRFYGGYLKKSGDVSMSMVNYGQCVANLKSGTVGVKVRILPPDVVLPDTIDIIENPITQVEEVKEEKVEKKKVKKKKVTKKKKKIAKKKVEQPVEEKNESKE